MTVKAQLVEDMKAALRVHDADRLGAIRYGLSEIKRVEIDAGELSDPAAQKVLATLIKQAQESIEQYRAGGRVDLVTAEEAKVKVWQSYLPAQLSDAELESIVQQVMADSPTKEFGKLMQQVMTKVAGRAPGQKVSELLKQALA
ncbi:MAG TPA: GatB/YqeY domain-containing protein [Candidatus Woesebacteria bacterium]|nr:GatB/YqeY domain-containing protein [Candidatus Woesebacteria bacterium]